MSDQACDPLDDGMRLQILRSMIPELKSHLIPSKIVPWLSGILEDAEAEQILDIETKGADRPRAVQKLILLVLRKKEAGLNQFIFALRGDRDTPAYDRFLEKLDGVDVGGNVNRPANEYFEFIIKLMRGDIEKHLTEGELHGIIEDLLADDALDYEDRDKILATLTHNSTRQAASQLITLMAQYSKDWPCKFFISLERQKEGFLTKIDPLAENPVVKTEENALGENLESLSASKESGREKPEDEQPSLTLPKAVTECRDETSAQASASNIPQTVRDMESAGSADSDALDQEDDAQSDADSSGVRDSGFSDDEKATYEASEKLVKGLPRQHEARDLCLRNYQRELAALAVAGHNTIICAPTGSGKTRVALHIVLEHLQAAAQEQAGAGGKKRKVVFLARTVPLVQQQYKNFIEYLPSSIKSVEVTGESMHSGNLHMLLPDYDVLVLTPKILENHLTHDKIPSLNAFSLIIFDECHHTRKGEPYNLMMKHYLKSKKAGDSNLPQIVGLTASIGIEKATTAVEAKKSILRVMGNLDVECISVVRENREELLRTVPRPDEPAAQELIQREDEISKGIKQNICKIEELQNESGEKMIDSKTGTTCSDPEVNDVLKMLNKRPEDPKEQKYAQWAVAVRKQAQLLSIKSEPKGRQESKQMEKLRTFCREMQVLADWQIAYSEALDVHDLSCPHDVLQHLKQKFEIQLSSKDKDGFTDLETQLFDFFKDLEKKLVRAEDENPNLHMLADIIRTHLKDNDDDDSRILVFVRTRATCKAVCRWLNSDKARDLQKLNARPFTGAGAHQDKGGMTLNEQEAVLEKFRSGGVSLLVSTSVGEEGIDIPECNLTIKYNHVGNEVTTVQTRGRSRKAGGKSILLAMPRIIMQERINRQREKYMLDAIEAISHMPQDEISRFVNQVQRETLEADAIDNLVRNTKRLLLRKEKFALVCGRCRKLRVEGDWIRTINHAHRVIVGQRIEDKVKFHPGDKPKRFGEVELRGSVVCKSCMNHLGQLLYYKKNQYMTVGLKQWILLDKNDIPSSCKRWKEVHYDIQELNEDDIKQHNGLPSGDDEQEGEDQQQGAAGGADAQ